MMISTHFHKCWSRSYTIKRRWATTSELELHKYVDRESDHNQLVMILRYVDYRVV